MMGDSPFATPQFVLIKVASEGVLSSEMVNVSFALLSRNSGHKTTKNIMNPNNTRSSLQDDQPIAILKFNQVVNFHQRALEHLRNGEETKAVLVLKEGLGLLRTLAALASVEPESRIAPDVLPCSLSLLSLPLIHASIQGQEAPCVVVSVSVNETLSPHGLDSALRIVTILTLYHMALAIHRGSCRVNGIRRLQITRSRELYDGCISALPDVPELKQIKSLVDSSIGHLCSMFDCAAAA
jgi:hypothetical protein